MKTRTKFNVSAITTYGNDGGRQVVLNAVIGDSDENKEFWKYTPSGTITLHIDNPEVNFEHGEYYVDFTKVEKL